MIAAGRLSGLGQRKVRVRKATLSRQTILDATAYLIAHRGYDSATLREIALAVGIKAGSIYYHFPSKEALAAAVLDEGIVFVHRAVEAARQDLRPNTPPLIVLEKTIGAHLQSLLEHSDYTRATIRAFSLVPADVRAGNEIVRRKYDDLWREILTDVTSGQKCSELNLDMARRLIIGGANWTLEWFRTDRDDAKIIAQHYANIVWSGICTAHECHREQP